MNKLPFFIVLLFFTATGFSQSVYKTPSGKKYHLENCRTVKNVSEKLSIAEAVNQSLDPCKICPPLLFQNHLLALINKKAKETVCSVKEKPKKASVANG